MVVAERRDHRGDDGPEPARSCVRPWWCLPLWPPRASRGAAAWMRPMLAAHAPHLHQDRRRRHHRPAVRGTGAEGRPGHRGLRHHRRGGRRAGAGSIAHHRRGRWPPTCSPCSGSCSWWAPTSPPTRGAREARSEGVSLVDDGMVQRLEQRIDGLVAQRPLPEVFIVPGANPASAVDRRGAQHDPAGRTRRRGAGARPARGQPARFAATSTACATCCSCSRAGRPARASPPAAPTSELRHHVEPVDPERRGAGSRRRAGCAGWRCPSR